MLCVCCVFDLGPNRIKLPTIQLPLGCSICTDASACPLAFLPPHPWPLPCWRQAGADPWKVLRQVREKLRLNAAAVQLPIGSEDQLRGLVDLIDRRAFHCEGASGELVVGESAACAGLAWQQSRCPGLAAALAVHGRAFFPLRGGQRKGGGRLVCALLPWPGLAWWPLCGLAAAFFLLNCSDGQQGWT